MQQYEMTGDGIKEAAFAQGLYGYTTYDAIPFFDTIKFKEGEPVIPLMRYRLYQYVIAFNHFKDEIFICENKIEGIDSEYDALLGFIKSKDVPQYPFSIKGVESSNLTDQQYREAVQKGIQHCMRGDVFQIVLSRRFQQSFQGDEFNVYRTLRNINPSPYLFFFDYGDYKLMGSSPEAQIVINNGKAIVHPIAGTFKRSGDAAVDLAMTQKLLDDPKENAEHVMLVDLARNDLSRVCSEVHVKQYRQVQYYSHVIHLVSEVEGTVAPNTNPFQLIAKTFPAGTLSGAPKFKAMQIIDGIEPTKRSYYGGCIGFVGFNGSCNQAIMIRSFLSRQNTLTYQAGAGVVAASVPENELQEVNNKLNALKTAIVLAENIHA
jgi:anthranilate synthase component 1